MDHRDFDALTRSAVDEGGTRRALLRLLAGGALGGLVARLGRSERAEATSKKKRKQHKARTERQQTGPLHAEGRRNKNRDKKPKKKPKRRCGDLVPLCTNCTEPRCNAATGEWVCKTTCPEGWSCCNGRCWEPCYNGCVEDPSQECTCQTPPTDEDVYCALEHLCGENPCPPGKEYDSATCTCRNLCPDGCPAGMEQDPSTCECRCPSGNPNCAGACCPANTVTCWWVPHLTQRYCQLADGRWVCPIGWTGSWETGCFPPATPETIDINGDAPTERQHAPRKFDREPDPRSVERRVGATGRRARRWQKGGEEARNR